MRRAFSAVAAVVLLAAACGGGDGTTATVPGDSAFVGADGFASVVTDTSRIVTLSGDLTEIVFELGLGDSVVGVDVTTVHPEEATRLPIIGLGRFLTAEGVLAQEPTLVIGDEQTDPITAIDQIRAAGVPVVILETATSFEALSRKIEHIGRLLDVPAEAADLARRIEREVAEAVSVLGEVDPPRMAYVYTRGPDVVLLFGEDMVSHPVIVAAGGIDAGAETGIERTIPVTAEALVAAAPDVIIVPEEGYSILGGLDAFLGIPGVAQTPAGRNGRVFAYPEGDFLTFGPRVAESLRRLIADVHGLP